ncbi:hypothetical protein, partial [Achromobacter xylosoxidans]|uniref:hypothetical protein n=1 Tax=Alcaligenes xylosoxydans xylosoxydans TaxID=85698 RepID=UPI0019554126
MKKAGGLDESREPVILAFLEICVSSRPYIGPSARVEEPDERRRDRPADAGAAARPGPASGLRLDDPVCCPADTPARNPPLDAMASLQILAI